MTGTRTRRQVADEALVRTLFAEHGKAMLAYATRLLGDRAAAEDVVQEALVRAWRNPQRVTDGSRSVRAWLLTVVRNLVVDRARARAARPTEVAESPTTVAVSRDHSTAVVDSIVVREALDGLSPEYREVLEQVYLRGHTVPETAAHLGIPAGTVKSRSHRALRALRESFGSPQPVGAA
ncbi:sigma-70 family RNA polymerase sigma factor [Amycolatopsis rhabdoformis]|uniref:RNA polymerase sigma factor n=1 Tax=Amycolatopsis rhabdoformis TaxID=1448059 RepID=A0ABZ1I2U8_9PSEU|nr:sigma-70 family RNA polymerase sigma factor [Amycolatopsis rhabdoformis]WSE28707.1 sigma-70 family RNA polymerase sigma factor [Amycolatopsis rhabdoformis]